MRPTHPRIIDAFEPLGIDTPTPRFGWVVNDAGRAESQTAYQVMLASSEADLAGGRSLSWDSGKVSGSDQYGIVYAGQALVKTTAYWWKVRTWNKEDTASPWSAPTRFVTGFLKETDWDPGTRWICLPEAAAGGKEGPLPLFRKEFEVSRPVREAYLYVTGLGQFVASLNGAKLGDHEIDPAWTDYDRSVAYVTFDVSAALQPGRNAIGVMLGTGWLNGADQNAIRSFVPMRLRAELHIVYDDGSAGTVATDPSWKTGKSPFVATELHGAEDYDARREQPGWNKVNFNDLAWSAAVVAKAPAGTLVAQSAPPVLTRQVFSPVKASSPAPRTQVFDFGQNMNGQYEIALRGAAGMMVKLLAGESLKPDGTVNPGRSPGSSYTLKGGGLETWRLTFSTVGFRYLEVVDAARAGTDARVPVIESARAFFTSTGATDTGTLTVSDPRYNQIYDLALRTIRSNLTSLHTDGPNFEKLGWQEVVATISPSAVYAQDLQTLLAKITRDLREGQRTVGLVPDIVPNWFVTSTAPPGDKFDDSPAWGCSAFVAPWLVYETYGDRRILEENYAMMTSYLAYLKTREKNGVVQYGLGDWMAPAGTQVPNIEGSIYVLNTRIMRDSARTLGKKADAALYGREYDRVRDAYNHAFFDSDAGGYRPVAQSTQALPLAFGIVPDGEEQRIVDTLVADIGRPVAETTEKGAFGPVLPDHVTTGDIGTTYLWRVLGDYGQDDLVQKMIMQPDAPGYWNLLQKGETTVTENWNSPRTRSHNHDMYAGIFEWLYRTLGGISPLEPGYARVRLKPGWPAGLKQVKCSYESVRGTVESDLSWDGMNGTWLVRIPVNATAKVYVPIFQVAPAAVAITESGTPIWQGGAPARSVGGVAFERTVTARGHAYVVWTVGSGSYHFAWH